MFPLLSFLLAALVSYCAAGFASRLAACLTFATTGVLICLDASLSNCFYMFHGKYLQNIVIV